MVGACADWFAVVALFRRPLGLPIPHTAIVPENKRRIGASLGRFVTNNFLSPRVAAERLRSIDIVGLAARGLADPRNAEAITAIVGRLAAPCDRRIAAGRGRRLDRRRRAARAPRRCRPRRSPRGRLSILWAEGAGQAVLDQGLGYRRGRARQQQGGDRRTGAAPIVAMDPKMGRRDHCEQAVAGDGRNAGGHAAA